VYKWEFQNTVNGRWYECRDQAISWVGKALVRMEIATDITERRDLEEVLRESEEKFRGITERSFDVIFTFDVKGDFTYISPAIEKSIGYSPGELIGKSFSGFMQQDKDINASELLADLVVQKKVISNLELRISKKDGTILYVEVNASPVVVDDAVVGVQGVLRDVTERKKAEETQKQLVVLIEATPDFVGFADAKDKHIIYVNKAGRKMCGIGNDEDVTKLKISDLHPEWANKMFVEEILPVAVRDGAWTGECAFLNIRDRQEIPVLMVLSSHKSSSGEVEVFSTISHDITERKQAEEKLKLFSDAVNSAFDYFFLTDLRGNITYANESAVRAYGYTREELLKLNIDNLDADPGAGKKLLQGMMAEGKWSGEVMNIRKNKEKFPADLSAFIILDEKGNPKGTMGIRRDITERKQIEAALRETSHNLSERVKELDCLKRVSDLIQKDGYPQDKLFQGIADIIPLSWQYPEATCARITFEGQEFRTENFRETAWMQTSDIILYGKWVGTVEVCYLQEKPEADEGPFLGEERNVINIIAERLSRYSERKQAEEQLKESEIRWSSLTENSYDTIMIVDSKSIIQFINKTTPPYTVEEIVGKPLYDYVAKEQHDAMRNSLVKVFKTGEPDSYEVSSIIPNLGTLWFSTKVVPIKIDGQVTRAILICADITDRKNMEEKMQEGNRRLNDIIEFFPDATFVIDREGKVLAWNRAIEKMTGVRKEEMIGQGEFTYAMPFYGERRPILIDLVLKPDDKYMAKYYSITMKDDMMSGEAFSPKLFGGAGAYVSATASQLKDEHGNIVGAIEAIRDVSASKKSAEELTAKVVELERFNRLMVGRELKMIELKREINSILDRLGEPPRYSVPISDIKRLMGKEKGGEMTEDKGVTPR
jgi:PAS domain S-box-containing protein